MELDIGKFGTQCHLTDTIVKYPVAEDFDDVDKDPQMWLLYYILLNPNICHLSMNRLSKMSYNSITTISAHTSLRMPFHRQ